MSATFSQTMRALAEDGARRPIAHVAAGAVLLAAWGAWFLRADVTEYAVSHIGRIEVGGTAYPVDAPVGGRVVASRLALGADVRAGEVLVELDAEAERRRLHEERARLEAITPELDALRRTLGAEEMVLRADRRGTDSEIQEERARQRAAELGALLAADEASRAAWLRDRGATSELDARRADTSARESRATADALALGVARSEVDRRTRESKTRVQMEDLRREMAVLEGRRATTMAAIDVLSHQIDRRSVRAPIDGRLGDAAALEVGAFVREGDRLGAVVPPGELRVVAEYAPVEALGRIRRGQRARLRLDGFPWTEFGTVGARVTEVGNEPRAGLVRVELGIVPEAGSRIPLEHGLPCAVEVEVEHATPASLVLRAVGKKTVPAPARDGEHGGRG